MINYLQAIILKKSICNSYWFSFAIITLYLHSFFSFFYSKTKIWNFLYIFNDYYLFLHITFVYKIYPPKEIISVDTIICLVLGFYFFFIKSYIDKIIMKNDIIYFGIISILMLKYYKIYIDNPINIYNISLFDYLIFNKII